ncbi:MAG: YdcF family protein [Candidatus Kryptoniota bacterium]
MKDRIIINAVVLFDIAGSLNIIRSFSFPFTLFKQLFTASAVPVLLTVTTMVVAYEVAFHKIKQSSQLFLLCLSVVFLAGTFYLQSEGIYRDSASIACYVSIMFQMGTAVALLRNRELHIKSGVCSGLALMLMTTAGSFAYTFTEKDVEISPLSADAVVVLGASVWGPDKPSPLLQGRLDRALEAEAKTAHAKIIVTGGTPRFGTVESEVEALYLRSKGIRDSDIIRDNVSLRTSDQARFIKDVIVDSLKLHKIVIVSDRWHLPRALLMCRWRGVDAEGLSSKYNLPLTGEFYYRLREAVALQLFIFTGV